MVSIPTLLDNLKQQQVLDKQNLYGSVEALAQQCQHAWEDCQKINLPSVYRQVDKILMTGMGGSGLGARIIESVYGDEIKSPLIRLNEYHLPGWVDRRTLVITSSFSGTTEETVANLNEAQKIGCPWLAIASGGSLIELAKKYNRPFYQINPLYNPSKQPRMAIGYLVISQLVLASKIGLFKFSSSDLEIAKRAMEQVLKQNNRQINTVENQAKQLALKLKDRGVVFVAARHLIGSAHTIKNQMNENAKNFSAIFDLPELNHHLMEGLAHPTSNRDNLFFVLINSKLYESRIRQRFEITEEVIKKNEVDSFTLMAQGESEIAQAFSVIQFGSLVNFYLSMLYELDPSPIPWVDYFKVKLGQPLGQWK